MTRRPAWLAIFGLLLMLAPLRPVRADLQQDVARVLAQAKLGKTHVAVSVLDVGAQRALVSINADDAMIPASNFKLVTTAAALDILGPDFLFRTELQLLDPNPEAAVVLVKGDGDPALGDARLLEAHKLNVETLLTAWVQALQKAGVRKIARLILDDRVFDRQLIHPDWPAHQLGQWYCAPVSGLSFGSNCLDVYAIPDAAGKPPRLALVPEAPFLKINNQALSGSSAGFGVRLTGEQNLDLQVWGGVKHRSLEPISVPVANPPVFFGRVFADRLGRAGIPVAALAQPGADDRLPAGRTLHALQTSLAAVLQRCNKNSQNLFAECLLKRAGRAATGNPGSWENGAAAVRMVIAKRLAGRGIGLVVADGSGLSRDNRVSASLLTGLLASMLRDPKTSQLYLDSLAIAGQDGTLEKRLDDLTTAQVYGKTGYINGVSTFSGCLLLPPAHPAPPSGTVPGAGNNPPPRGPIIAFSILFNDLPPNLSIHQAKAAQDQIVRTIAAAYAPSPNRARD